MTKQEIITQILIPIFTALVASFSKSIIDKVFKAYKPAIKKAISVIKKFLVFALRYICPALYITFLLIKTTDVDKYFVFNLAILCSTLVLNIVIDVNNQQLRRHFILLGQQDKIIDHVTEIAELGISTTKNLSNLTKIASEQIEMMKTLTGVSNAQIDMIKDLTKKTNNET
jgi:hypothetical protein